MCKFIILKYILLCSWSETLACVTKVQNGNCVKTGHGITQCLELQKDIFYLLFPPSKLFVCFVSLHFPLHLGCLLLHSASGWGNIHTNKSCFKNHQFAKGSNIVSALFTSDYSIINFPVMALIDQVRISCLKLQNITPKGPKGDFEPFFWNVRYSS